MIGSPWFSRVRSTARCGSGAFFMSVRQDRFTFFGVLVAVVIVVLGYLQLGQLYPVAGREDSSGHDAQEAKASVDESGDAPLEGEARP